MYDGTLDPVVVDNWKLSLIHIPLGVENPSNIAFEDKVHTESVKDNRNYNHVADQTFEEDMKNKLLTKELLLEEVRVQRDSRTMSTLVGRIVSRQLVKDICHKMVFDYKSTTDGKSTNHLAPYSSFSWSSDIQQLSFCHNYNATENPYNFELPNVCSEGQTHNFARICPPIFLALFASDGFVRNEENESLHYAGILSPEVNNRSYSSERSHGFKDHIMKADMFHSKTHLPYSALFFSRSRNPQPEPKTQAKMVDIFSGVNNYKSETVQARNVAMNDLATAWKVSVSHHAQ
jgi:hypothetical protein